MAERFAPVVPHAATLRLYNAFFVSRSWCEKADYHCDYFEEVGTRALTLITPLRDYAERRLDEWVSSKPWGVLKGKREKREESGSLHTGGGSGAFCDSFYPPTLWE